MPVERDIPVKANVRNGEKLKLRHMSAGAEIGFDAFCSQLLEALTRALRYGVGDVGEKGAVQIKEGSLNRQKIRTHTGSAR